MDGNTEGRLRSQGDERGKIRQVDSTLISAKGGIKIKKPHFEKMRLFTLRRPIDRSLCLALEG
jgi:hypothetical protein